MNQNLKNGLLLAGSLILLFMTIYLIGKPISAWNFGWLMSFFIPTGLGIFFVRKSVLEDRGKKEGTISFGEAFASGFATVALGLTLFLITTFIVYKSDSSYYNYRVETEIETAQNAAGSIVGLFGMKGEDFDEAMEVQAEAIRKVRSKFNVGTIALEILSALIFPGALIALLTAAIVKKN